MASYINFVDGSKISVPGSVVETQVALTEAALFVALEDVHGHDVVVAPAHVTHISTVPGSKASFR